MNAQVKKMEFLSDHLLIQGLLHLPDVEYPPLVVGSHGLEGTKESAKQKRLAHLLPQNGIAYLRFDHRGCGQSQGDFIKDTSLEKRATDLLSAIQSVIDLDVTQKRICLFGSSLGGSTCILAWDMIVQLNLNLCGAVLCAAPVKSRTIENIPIEATEKRGALPISFFKDNLIFNLSSNTGNLKNVLLFHGDQDNIVPVSNAHEIYQQVQPEKRLIIHKNGDHQMTSIEDQKEFESLTVDWFLQCFSTCSGTPS